MPYLPNSQAFLDQSSLLLEAYPDTTRITTKYSFPSTRRRTRSSSKPTTDQPEPKTQAQPQPQQPIASLTLKTFNPHAGICLKYRTNKAAEVGRLMLALGRLAAGKDVSAAALGGAVAAPAAVGAGDVEMGEAGAGTGAGEEAAGAAGKGGKGKKKGGKGKR